MQLSCVQLSWAVQGINNLSYDALPPLPPIPTHAPGRRVKTSPKL